MMESGPLFVYAAVARGKCVIAEHIARNAPEDIPRAARQALLRLPPQRGRRSYVFQSHLFSFEALERGEGGGVQLITRVEKELEAVTDLVKDNINSVLERNEQIECLVGKTSTLKEDAVSFRQSARRLKRHVWWSTARTYILKVTDYLSSTPAPPDRAPQDRQHERREIAAG
ncbi:uncharacterized protein LOC34623695 [Cyclospora cayetanensis]|uniref:Uncharacterized protein LOC34623695 n=1 Tax=Cyclospora cayetanensis TaxID=88456 RepID=A0A6P6RWG6_9EIME|nr:uncharacterized protein LOC34623695 [Cyclospora cayetanensis]